MPTELAKGVQLHVVPTEKFKTIRILIRFTTLLNHETITKRTLLSSLMETNSYKYPTQTAVSAKLADLYGAGFGINVNKKGNQHWFNLSMNLVNDQYLNDPKVLPEAVEFIKDTLFSPNLSDGAFEAETFGREKENLKAYMESVAEDKQTYAALELQELYFQESEDQRIPSFGTIADLEKETAQTMAEYYQTMMSEDLVDILVIGDVDTAEITRLFQRLPFSDRASGAPNIFYQQTAKNLIREQQERQDIIQSKLNLGYHTDIYFYDPQYFALQVFNGIFGGFPHSKLFMNVRERESMAYYASSGLDTFRGYMSVQTGIDGQNRDQVVRLVAEQLEHIRAGQISDEELQQTKAMLKNHYLLSLDNPAAVLETAFMAALLPQSQLTAEAWLARVDQVTKEEVMRVAAQVELQAIFFLEGGMNHG